MLLVAAMASSRTEIPVRESQLLVSLFLTFSWKGEKKSLFQSSVLIVTTSVNKFNTSRFTNILFLILMPLSFKSLTFTFIRNLSTIFIRLCIHKFIYSLIQTPFCQGFLYTVGTTKRGIQRALSFVSGTSSSHVQDKQTLAVLPIECAQWKGQSILKAEGGWLRVKILGLRGKVGVCHLEAGGMEVRKSNKSPGRWCAWVFIPERQRNSFPDNIW